MTAQVVMLENDVERDRKTCIALAAKATGANRELAQWLLEHPRYTASEVAGWGLGEGYGKRTIQRLRKWASEGFIDAPHAHSKAENERRRAAHSALNSLDNSEVPPSYFGNEKGDDVEAVDIEIADAATVEDNALHSLARMTEHARVFKKLFKNSTFDREAETRINTAIERMIQKWRSTQATLTQRRP